MQYYIEKISTLKCNVTMYFHVKGRIVNSKYQLSLLFIVFMEMYLNFPSEFLILYFTNVIINLDFFFSFYSKVYMQVF